MLGRLELTAASGQKSAVMDNPFPRKFAGLLSLNGYSHARFVEALARQGFETSDGTVNNWANGSTEPTRPALAAISKALGINVAYLVYDEIPPLNVASAHPLPPEVAPQATSVRERFYKQSTPPAKQAKRRRG